MVDAKLPRELNLIYCPIYLDDIVIFSHTAEEHLHHLCVGFDQFREHNLKLKLLKCNFFREEITYLAHWVSRIGVWLSNSNLKAIVECMPPKTYTEVCTFLGLVGHYKRFIKGFAYIAQPLNEHLTGERSQQKVRAGGTFRGCLEDFQNAEMSMYDSSGSGFCWLYQTISVGEWCIKRWVRGSVVPEACRWMISPCHL